jgi:signal transduction histidine kinase/ActR/RegA family two-component response regulator
VLGQAAYDLIRPYLDAALAGRRVEFELELPYRSRAPRWEYAVHEPERSATGQVIGLVAVVTDITERKLAEQEMALARDRALAASRAKDDFLARLSHELRTPLNPVLLLASDAANNPALPPPVRADFEMIAANVTLEARLIDDLLDLTRIARGKMALDARPSDVHAALRSAIQMIQADAALKRIAVVTDLGAELSVVLGDDVRLKQVFWNLLQNAVKFTPEGGRITIASSTEPNVNRLAIRIHDTGIGMTPAELQRVFHAFEQGDHATQNSSHRFGGLGLGLAIARMLVELHSGSISASSEGTDTGTMFTVELPLLGTPLESADPAATVATACALTPPAEPETAHRPRILLVEDHTPTRLALANLLIRRQCEVVTAGDMAAARMLVGDGQFDLLISDIGLPDGNGCDLMREFRDHYNLRGIALTGYGSQEDIERSEAAGFSTHLTKPVSMQALDCALTTAVGAPGGGPRVMERSAPPPPA